MKDKLDELHYIYKMIGNYGFCTVQELLDEYNSQKETIDKSINAIDLVIELIKQQPTEDDRWILDRLNGFKIILEDKEV